MLVDRSLQKGEVVVFRKRSRPSLGVLERLSGESATIFSEEGKELDVDASKLLLATGIKYSQGMSEEDKKLALRALRRELEELKTTVDLETLWHCVSDSQEGIAFKDLIGLQFGSGEGGGKDELVFFWALDKDTIYFKRQPDDYMPRTGEEVGEILKRKEAEEKNLAERAAAVEWAKSVLKGEHAATGGADSDFAKYVDTLRNFVIHLDRYDKAPEARSFMSLVGLKNVEDTIKFLIKAGYWNEDDDPVFLRLGVSRTFPAKVFKESAKILGERVSFDGLMDLTALSTYSIDDDGTEDVDDAISISSGTDGLLLAVHIADVAWFVEKGGALDEEALRRGESIYLPEGHVHMFPIELIMGRLSLFAGEPHRALSLLVYLDEELNITNYTLQNTKISVDRNLTYANAEQILRSTEEGGRLFDIAAQLRQRRIDSGGVVVDLPDLKVRVDAAGDIGVKKNYMTTPAHIVVAECMILANRLAGEYLKTRGVPTVYRYLAERVPDDVRDLDPDDPLYPVRAVRFLRPSRFGLSPLPHEFLGVKQYVQISSPIRRYMDLVMQRQIFRALKGLSLGYTSSELEKISYRVEMSIKDKKVVEKTRVKFWLYKFLQQRVGEGITGFVSHMNASSMGVYIPDFLLDITIPLPGDGLYEVGSEVNLIIESVDPMKRKITLIPASFGV